MSLWGGLPALAVLQLGEVPQLEGLPQRWGARLGACPDCRGGCPD